MNAAGLPTLDQQQHQQPATQKLVGMVAQSWDRRHVDVPCKTMGHAHSPCAQQPAPNKQYIAACLASSERSAATSSATGETQGPEETGRDDWRETCMRTAPSPAAPSTQQPNMTDLDLQQHTELQTAGLMHHPSCTCAACATHPLLAVMRLTATTAHGGMLTGCISILSVKTADSLPAGCGTAAWPGVRSLQLCTTQLLPLLPCRRASAAAAMAAAAATTALAARPWPEVSSSPILFCTLPLLPGTLNPNRPPNTPPPLPPPAPAAAALWLLLLLPFVEADAVVLMGSMLAVVLLPLVDGSPYSPSSADRSAAARNRRG